MRQVYNKTRSYLEWMAARVGGSVTIVDDGDMAALAAAITPETRFVFAETFTNPLVRAQDFDALRDVIDRARDRWRRRSGSCSTPRSRRRGRSRLPPLAERRRHRRRQRHQVAWRQRSRHVGLHRDQRYAVRELGDGSDRHARRHPRLAPGRGGRVGVRWRQRIACASIGDGVEGRGIPERASEGQRGLSSVAAESSRSGRDRQALRPSRIDAVVPDRGRRRRSHAALRRRARHHGDRPLRAVVRRPGDEGEPSPHRFRILHRARIS